MSMKLFSIISVLFFLLSFKPANTHVNVDLVTQNNLVHIIDVPGKEMGFLINFDASSKTFDRYFVLKYTRNKSLINTQNWKEVRFISFTNSALKLQVNNEDVYVFAISTDYKLEGYGMILYGESIAEYNARAKPFKLLEKKTFKEINDLIEK
jgi:hypothetical protein